MTDELRALLRADLAAERPPPIGDVVGDALRDGRRIRRRRRIAAAGAGATVFGLVTAMLVGGGIAAWWEPARRSPGVEQAAGPNGQPGGGPAPLPSGGAASQAPATVPAVPGGVAASRPGLPPGSVPVSATAPPALARARTLTIHSGTAGAGGRQKRATSAGMIQLLTELLPAGRASRPAVAADDERHVRLHLDRGAGTGLLHLRVDQIAAGTPRPARGSTVEVTVRHFPDDCVRAVVVDARWADGTVVRLDVATCMDVDGRRRLPTEPALTPDEAVEVVADPRWGVTMNAGLVDRGDATFPRLPEFG